MREAYVIRPWRDSDRKALEKSVNEYGLNIVDPCSPVVPDDNCRHHSVVAQFGGKVVGYAAVIEIGGDAGLHVFVMPDHRAAGLRPLGMQLVDGALQAARAAGIKRVTARMSWKNAAALLEAKKLGFVPLGGRTTGVNRGYYDFEKEL